MTAAFKTFACAATVATLAALPAAAMPVTAPSSQGAIVKVSGWATRAEGRRQTYPSAYGYGYGYGYGRGAYGGWGEGGYGDPYGYDGRAVPPAYGYGYEGDAYGY